MHLCVKKVPRNSVGKEINMSNPGLRNLVSWWALEEDSGSAADSHGANHLTRVGVIGNADAKQGKGINFQNVTGRYLSIGNTPSLEFGHEDFTIGCWFKPETLYGGDYPMPFYNKVSDSGTYRMEIIFGAQPNKKIRLHTAGGYVDWGSVMTAGNWYFAVGWHVASENKSYLQVNNASALSYTDTIGGGLTFYNLSSRVGRHMRGGEDAGIKGILDEMFIYRRALNDDERSWLYNNGDGRRYFDLRQSGTTAVDLSGYAIL